jgi:hypothetical protein
MAVGCSHFPSVYLHFSGLSFNFQRLTNPHLPYLDHLVGHSEGTPSRSILRTSQPTNAIVIIRSPW